MYISGCKTQGSEGSVLKSAIVCESLRFWLVLSCYTVHAQSVLPYDVQRDLSDPVICSYAPDTQIAMTLMPDLILLLQSQKA